MYYKLKKNYHLRGWEKLGTGVWDSENNRIAFLPEAHYRTLRFCNGMLDENSVMFSEDQKQLLLDLEKAGFVDKLKNPSALDAKQQYRRFDNRFINMVHWSITGKCNYRCRHCYMSAPHAKLGEFSSELCMNIIDQFEECGIYHVSLTGGEPLFRRDFLQIVDRLLEKNISIDTIYSNGKLVTDDLLDALAERGIYPEFNMSFDGVDGQHNWLRGMADAEVVVIDAFKRCRDKGFPTGSELCIHKGNAHTLRESINLLASVGVSSLKISRLIGVGEGTGLGEYIMTPQEEYETYLAYLPHYFEDGEPLRLMLSNLFYSSGTGRHMIPGCHSETEFDCAKHSLCGHARNVMYLAPDGRILPCIPISNLEEAEQQFPKITDITLKEALADSWYMQFIDTNLEQYWAHNPECASCSYRWKCAGGCRGNVVSDGNADLLGKDEVLCAFYKKGFYDRTKALLERYERSKEK